MSDALRHVRTRTERNRSAKLLPSEQRFYSTTPRYEETVKRVCGKSVVMFRSEVAESLNRGLQDFEIDYQNTRKDCQANNKPVADLEGRFGAAVVLVHLQILSKVNELLDLAQAGTPVSDIERLAENIAPICERLGEIEARASVATTGDLNEEERNRVRYFNSHRFVRLARAVQLRREAQAAVRRYNDGKRDLAAALSARHQEQQLDAEALILRAKQRAAEIRAATGQLRSEGDVTREVELDQLLQQVDGMLKSSEL